MLLLLAGLARAATVYATLDLGPDGPVLVDAILTDGELRVPNQPGELQIVGEDGATLFTTAFPDPRHRDIIAPEGGRGDGAELVAARVRVAVPWPSGATKLHLGAKDLTPRRATPPRGAGATLKQIQGDELDRLDLVFLGDGYTSDQLATYGDDVDRVVSYLRDTVEPYGTYQQLFNIWRIDEASPKSGASHTGSPGSSAYGCYYNCGGIERLICCDDSKVLGTIDDLIPGADGIVVMVNDPEYGGSGGFNYATAYTGMSDGVQVAAHEMGHSLVGLWDEYGYYYNSGGYNADGPNCSHDGEPAWDQWTGDQGVGAYLQCSYEDYYRPTDNECMMRSLQDGYCAVCREQTVLAMYSHVPGLISDVQPPPGEVDALDSPKFKVSTYAPEDKLTFEWSLDGALIGTGANYTLACGSVGSLTLEVRDETKWVREDPNSLLLDSAGPWTVTTSGTCPETTTASTSTGGGKGGTGGADYSCDTAANAAAPWGLASALALLVGARRRKRA